jgi:hypothetical protein
MGRLRKDHIYLILLLVVGLLNGLAFVFLVPPWQHYDEPNHFEYAWLIANRGRLPKLGEYDQDMRRATAISMIEHNFFKGMNFTPDLEPIDQPIWIGQYSQLGDPPLYYLLGSLPLWLPVESITTQLYLVRMVSLLLYLVSIFAAWGIMREITSEGNLMRLLVPLTLALLPGFSDVMTAVNNLVAGTVFFLLCLWGCVRLLVKGFSVINFLWAVSATLLCLFTAATAYLALPIFLLSVVMAIFHGKWRAVAFVSFCLVLLAGLVIIIKGDDAAFWYRSSLQDLPIRAQDGQAVIGTYVFQIDAGGEISPEWLVPAFQSIGKGLPAGTYSFGAWMWASQPMSVQTPTVGVGSQVTSNSIELGITPAFYAFPVEVKKDGLRTWISLAPKAGPVQEGLIYYDGLVLAQGVYPLDQAPAYAGVGGEHGTWGGKTFQNLVRNASAEAGGLRFIPSLDRIGGKVLPDNTIPSLLLTYLVDWKGAGWHYADVGRILLRSFWGAFGWGHVPLLRQAAYTLLAFFTVVAIAGCLARLILTGFKKDIFPFPRQFSWDIAMLFVLVFMLAWGSTFVRGTIYLASPVFYIPVARYAFPAILPTSLILAGGWTFILSIPFAFFKRWKDRPQAPAGWIYGLCLLTIDLYALWSITLFYRV